MHESTSLAVGIDWICNYELKLRQHEACVSWLERYCFDGVDEIDISYYGLVSYFSPPDLIIHCYDYLISRIHNVYDTDLKGTPIIRKTLDLIEVQFVKFGW